jgi:hypothetical protein
MSRIRRARIQFFVLATAGAAACSGSMTCQSCGGNALTSIPGGFDPAARIDRGAQARVTGTGLQFIDASFQPIMTAYSKLHCGAMGDVPCPSGSNGFLALPAGTPDPSSCDSTRMVCVEQATGKPGPLLGFQIQRSTSNNATICRDDPTAPNARPCYAWLRLESLNLTTQGPNALSALVTTQIRTTDIPIQVTSPISMNCVVSIDSSVNSMHTQDFTLNLKLGQYMPPSGTGGGQLQITVQSLNATIPDASVNIKADPIDGGPLDNVLCAVANLGPVKSALIPTLTSRLATVASEAIDNQLGWKCNGANTQPCPAQSTCNAQNLCQDTAGHVVPQKIGLEGRADFSNLLGGLTSRPGQGDLSFLVGGTTVTDTAGMTLGALGGINVVTPDPACAMILPAPRLRPGWMPPPPLPIDDKADLDFDGVPETPFMLALGISNDLLSEGIWTIYTSGLLCQTISATQVDLLNTGSLALLVPSLNQLTHADRYRDAIFPARLSIQPGGEPIVTIRTGKVDQSGTKPVLVDPLVDLFLPSLKLGFYAQVEERWIRLMNVTTDLHLGLGAVVNAQNQIEFVLGDLTNALSNVQVTDSEILTEDPTQLALAIPSLVEIALPRITGALQPIALPNAMQLGGFDLTVLGIRGVPNGSAFPNLAVYANLGFDPSMAPNLSVQAETEARVASIQLPPPTAFAVENAGGPKIPAVELELSGRAPRGGTLEYQLRIDGGLWTPFFQPEHGRLVLERPEFLVEGHHALEVRARVAGEYRTLDPTPVQIDLVIDAEPPHLVAQLDLRGVGVVVDAYDAVSHDAVRVQVGVEGRWRNVTPNADGFVAVPEVSDPSASIAVAATDEQGLRAEVILRMGAGEAASAVHSSAVVSREAGCACVREPRSHELARLLGASVLLSILLTKRRRRS